MINTEQRIKKALKALQLSFFYRVMDFTTKEEADDLRKKVTRPIRSKKFKRFY